MELEQEEQAGARVPTCTCIQRPELHCPFHGETPDRCFEGHADWVDAGPSPGAAPAAAAAGAPPS
eukprot:278098-Alexandrium_andersonii.AAC.1